MDAKPLTVGHILLADLPPASAAAFVEVIEALAGHGIRQQVIVRERPLARRASRSPNVSAAPATSSTAVAVCLVADADVVHVHDEGSATAGLLLALTRSIPYVFTKSDTRIEALNPVACAAFRRAASVICTGDEPAGAVLRFDARIQVDVVPGAPHPAASDPRNAGRVARQLLRIYRRTVDSNRVPAMMI